MVREARLVGDQTKCSENQTERAISIMAHEAAAKAPELNDDDRQTDDR